MLMRAVAKKRRATGQVGGSNKRPQPQSLAPPSDDQQAGEEVAPPVSPPALPLTAPLNAPPIVPPIDLTTDTPSKEPRAVAVHSNVGPNTLGAEPAEPAVMPASKEGPPMSGDVVGAMETTVEDASTGVGIEGTPPVPRATSMPLASAGPAGGRTKVDPPRVSLTYNDRIAKRLLAKVCLPELQVEFGQLDTPAILQDAFAAHLWAVNSLSALRDTALRSDRAHKATLAAMARAEEAESTLKVARREAEGALEMAQGEAEATRRALGVARREAEEAKRTMGLF